MSFNLIQYNLVDAGDQQYLTVLIGGKLMPPIDDSHPNFDEIKSIVEDPEGVYGEPINADDLETLADLFDISAAVAKKFDKLSERVSVANGAIYFDGDPIHGTIVETILRFLEEGADDFKPLVNYIEKIAANPEPHSKEQLYDWLKLHDTISITPEGDLIAYKGVSSDGKGGYHSGFTGTATVDGEVISGHIPNYVGAEVTMPRSQVAHDPSTACHTGLHVGTFDYARSYSSGAMLAVRVNPRDVVSVPTDGGGAKIRVCRYVVEEIIQAPHTGVLVDEYSGDSDGAAEALKTPVDTADVREDKTTDVVLDGAAVKVGDFVRYVGIDGTGNGSQYGWIGVVTKIETDGTVVVQRPKEGLGSNSKSSDWRSSPSLVAIIPDPNERKALKVGDLVVDAREDRGTIVASDEFENGFAVRYDDTSLQDVSIDGHYYGDDYFWTLIS